MAPHLIPILIKQHLLMSPGLLGGHYKSMEDSIVYLNSLRLSLKCFLALSLLAGCFAGQGTQDVADRGSHVEVFEPGFYGYSPTSISVVWPAPEPWVGFEVFRNLGGVRSSIQTLVSQSRAVGLSSNSRYSLSLYGRGFSGELSTNVLLRGNLETWPLFSMSRGVSLREEKLGPAGVTLDINYDPFVILPPGPGVNALTRAECFISDIRNPGSDRPITDPLAHQRSFLVAQQSLFIGIREIEFLNPKRVQCQVRYADDTVSVSNKIATLQAFRGGEYGACENSVNQDGGYSCQPMVCPPGLNDPASCNTAGPFELTSNSCSAWLSKNSTTGLIEGSPSNLNVGSCSYEYKLSGLGAVDIISRKQQVTVSNLQPVVSMNEVNGTTPMKQVSSKATIVIRERSPSGSATGSHTSSATNKSFGAVMSSDGTVSLSDAQVESNEERLAISRGVDTGGRYSVSLGSCESHLNPGSGFRGKEFEINALTGAISFRMREHFYGECEIEIHFDDMTNSETRTASALPLRIRVYPVNDEPKLIFFNGVKHSSDALNVDRCGTNLDSSCLISEEIVRDINISGGVLSVPAGLQETNYKEDQPVAIKNSMAIVPNSIDVNEVLILDPVASKMNCTTNCELQMGDQLSAFDFKIKEAAGSASGSFQMAYTPFNPDVKQVKAKVTFEDAGYACEYINSLSRAEETICDSNNEAKLFGGKEFTADLHIYTGEFMDRDTDFIVAFDTSSMGAAVIESAKETIATWYETELPILSPKNRGRLLFVRTLGVPANYVKGDPYNRERWNDVYLAQGLKVAYGHTLGNIAYGNGSPDYGSSRQARFVDVDGNSLVGRVPSGSDVNVDAGDNVAMIDDITESHLNQITSQEGRHVFLLSFCDEAAPQFHSTTLAKLKNSDPIPQFSVENPAVNFGSWFSATVAPGTPGATKAQTVGYECRTGVCDPSYAYGYARFKRFYRQLKNNGGSFKGIAYPIVAPSNGGKDFLLHSIAALYGRSLTAEEAEALPRNPVFTQQQWDAMVVALQGPNPFEDIVDPAAPFESAGLIQYGWSGKFDRFYISSGRAENHAEYFDPGATIEGEPLPLDQFTDDMRFLRP